MSSAGLVYSYEDLPDDGFGHPSCDICGMPAKHGAFFVRLERRPGVALFMGCIRCVVELSFECVREFWPRGVQPPEEDPPPEKSSGGGSTC